VSDYKAIAATTQTLLFVLQAAIRPIRGAQITQVRPEDQPAGAAKTDPRLNVYLIETHDDPTMRSSDLPMRDEHGRLVSVPRVTLNLRYMLSFFGAPPAPHLMLGATEIALRVNAVVTPDLARRAVAHHPDLQGSGIDRQEPPVQFVPASLTLEAMSRFWSGFFQVPYTLSTFYDATAVQIEAPLPITASLPVQAPKTAGPGQPPDSTSPVGDRLGPRLDPFPPTPVEPGARVLITGQNLTAGLFAGIADRWAEVEEDAKGSLGFHVPPTLSPGAHDVRLGAAGTHGEPVPVAGSLPQRLAVRPLASDPAIDSDAGAQSILVTIDPAPDPLSQTLAVELVALSGSGWSTRIQGGAPVDGEPSRFRFAAPATRGEPQPIPAGSYVVMVEVDGIASLPRMTAGRYSEPEVTVP
jgi:hypothetical protein